MFVYLVFHEADYEGSSVVGVFSDYEKARSFQVEYDAKFVESKYEGTVIRKVEVDKVDWQSFWEIGEEV